MNDAGNTGIYALNHVANYDKDIIPYLKNAALCAYVKVKGSSEYKLDEGEEGEETK